MQRQVDPVFLALASGRVPEGERRSCGAAAAGALRCTLRALLLSALLCIGLPLWYLQTRTATAVLEESARSAGWLDDSSRASIGLSLLNTSRLAAAVVLLIAAGTAAGAGLARAILARAAGGGGRRRPLGWCQRGPAAPLCIGRRPTVHCP